MLLEGSPQGHHQCGGHSAATENKRAFEVPGGTSRTCRTGARETKPKEI